MKFTDDEIDARERSVTVLILNAPLCKEVRVAPTAAALMTNDSTQGCSYCGQNDSSTLYRNVTAWYILVETNLCNLRRCFVCLRKFHK